MLANWVKQNIASISSTPATGRGDITLSTAVSGYVAIGDQFSDGELLYYTIEEGNDRESGIGTYTASGTVLARTTPLETLSSGTFLNTSPVSTIAFTSAAVVSVSAVAQHMNHQGYYTVAETVVGSNVTAIPGRHYELDIDGMTAERQFILPIPTEIGQQIRVKLTTDAPTTLGYELEIIGAATVKINGGTAAQEWSRLFIKDEVVEFRATSLVNWDVVQDGRIPCSAVITLTTDAQETATGWTIPTSASTAGAWTENRDIGGCMDHTTGKFTCRRGGTYQSVGRGTSDAAVADGNQWGVMIFKNATTTVAIAKSSPGTLHQEQYTYGGLYAMDATDYVELKFYQNASGYGLNTDSTFTVQELL